MSYYRGFVLGTLLISGIAVAAPPVAPEAGWHRLDAGTFAGFEQAVSADFMQGRKPGTVGEKRITRYLIERFRAIGLQPGFHGSWTQRVPVVGVTLKNAQGLTLNVTEGGSVQRFAIGREMMVLSRQARPVVDLKDSPVIFVGYGIDAPNWHWNDYAGTDVRGKTVIMLVNDPGFATGNSKLFRGRTMTYYGRWDYKYQAAARQGAAAGFVVHTSNAAAAYPWAVVENSWGGEQLSLPTSVDPGPRLPVAGWLTRAAAERLFKRAGLNFAALLKQAAQPGFRAVPLPAKASIRLQNKIRHFESNNIAALLPGRTQPHEAIVFSAHWDHLGMDPSLKGHQIYNGAIDNGTGLAVMLSLAGAYAAAPERPQRSILFMLPTLEESGLLGSQYYVRHPAIPLDQTVADINVDAWRMQGPAHNMILVGSGQSSLDGMLRKVLAMQGRTLTAELNPQNGTYFRSDHFNFAKAGVPALYVSSGLDLLRGGTQAGLAGAREYVQHHYHTPRDVLQSNWNFAGAVPDMRALYRLGWWLADSSIWPYWNAQSAFHAAGEKLEQQREGRN